MLLAVTEIRSTYFSTVRCTYCVRTLVGSYYRGTVVLRMLISCLRARAQAAAAAAARLRGQKLRIKCGAGGEQRGPIVHERLDELWPADRPRAQCRVQQGDELALDE